MLTPVPMIRVELIALDRDLLALSERVGVMAALQPVDVRQLGPWAEPMAWAEMEELAAEYGSLRRRLDRALTFLQIPPTEVLTPVRLAPEEVLHESTEQLGRVEPEVRELEERLRNLQARRSRLQVIEGQLQMLAPLEIDLAELRNLRFLYMASGLVPVDNVQRLEDSLRDIPHALIRLQRVRDRVLLFAFCRREEAPVLDRALESAYVERVEIPPELSGTPARALADLAGMRAELEEEFLTVETDGRAVGDRWWEELQHARSEAEVNARVVEVWRRSGRTERTRLLAGWVPEAELERLAAGVRAATGGRSVLSAVEPSPTREVGGMAPTALANPALLRPFEGLTRTYGLPDYWDLDPTPLAGGLFVLMFGAMFGDVGQGAVLALLGLLMAIGRPGRRPSGGAGPSALPPGRRPPGPGDSHPGDGEQAPRPTSTQSLDGRRQFGWILAACGGSAMVFGVLYGSVFGSEELIPALWLRPMENPLLLIGVAVGVGAAVISVGLILGAVGAWRRRDRAHLYLGQSGLVGLWLYWGLMVAALLAALAPGRLGLAILLPLVGVPLVLIFLHGPIARSLEWAEDAGDGAYYIQSGVEAFDLVIRFASNTLSFLRLGAFALAHVGLGLTVYALAELVHGLPGVPVLVLILGNALIVGLEGLIVGIQALRLEYYEFFTKFLHGGGVAYRPFALYERREGSG